jgi:hypothetical protein
MLTCRLNPSIGFVIFGHQSMECRLVPNPPLPAQAYEGALNTIGLDLGVTAGGVLGWAVLAPTAGPPPGALAGEYVGASGDVGMGLAPVSTCWSAVPDAASPCNQCRSKGPLPSTLRSAFRGFSYAPCTKPCHWAMGKQLGSLGPLLI